MAGMDLVIEDTTAFMPWFPLIRPALQNSINTTRKATVAYPTVKRLLFDTFYATHTVCTFKKLLKSHEMV